MALEIERKFLVVSREWQKSGKGTSMRQGYLCADKLRSVRIRLEGRKGTLTIKGPARGSSRAEYEYPIPFKDAVEMLKTLCEKPLIEKIRTRVRFGGLVWEIDEFLGANEGLIVAEVELQHRKQTVKRPPWIGEEVTHDPRYLNANLYKNPYRNW